MFENSRSCIWLIFLCFCKYVEWVKCGIEPLGIHGWDCKAKFRVYFEATVRAYWLLMVASNDEIQHFEIKNEDELLEMVKIPKASGMINKWGNVAEIKQIVESFKAFTFNCAFRLQFSYSKKSWLSSQSTFGCCQAGQWLYYDGSPNSVKTCG